LGRRHHPGGDGHCHPANVVVASLDLADVQPGPNPNLDAAKLVPKGDRAAAITKPRSRPALVVAPPWPRGAQSPRWNLANHRRNCLSSERLGTMLAGMGPASSWAMMAACSEPTVSSTTVSSSAHDSHGGSRSSRRRSETPVPRRSKRMTRGEGAQGPEEQGDPGIFQTRSMCPKLPTLVTTSGGPCPNTW
jgi:hypothetical protein